MTKGMLSKLAEHCDQPLGIPYLDAMVDKYADKPFYHRFLYKLGAHLGANLNPLYVELGVWLGDSAAHFIAGYKTVDADQSFPLIYGVDHTFQMNEPMRSEKDFIFIKGDSRDYRVSGLFDDCSIDVLFIDTHHKYEVMERELKLWAPKVSPQGVILADDVCSPLESCSELWDELKCEKLTMPELHVGGWGFGVLFPPFEGMR